MLPTRPHRKTAPSLSSAVMLFLLAAINAYPAPGLAGDADPSTTPASAELAITLLLEARVGYEADEVRVEIQDAATRLSDCDNPAPFLPREDTPLWGRVTVGIKCDNPPTPRYLQIRVIALGSYVTAATVIQPGTRIESWMLGIGHGDLGALPARALRDPEQVVGQEARQRLTEGSPVQAHQLRSPLLVTRGQIVAVEARGRGFTISREGEALDSAGLGEPVRVRISRNQTLNGTVIGAGRVGTLEQ